MEKCPAILSVPVSNALEMKYKGSTTCYQEVSKRDCKLPEARGWVFILTLLLLVPCTCPKPSNIA